MDAVKKVARGKTYYGDGTIPTTFEGGSIEIEGVEREFENVAPGQTTQVKVKRDGRMCRARLMRNATAATTLAAGDVVTHKAGYRNRRVGAVAAAANSDCVGVVDDQLGSGGCRVGDLCWVFFYGPVVAKKATGTAWTEGDLLASNNAGKATAIGVPADATAAQANSYSALGRAFADAGSADTTGTVDLNIR